MNEDTKKNEKGEMVPLQTLEREKISGRFRRVSENFYSEIGKSSSSKGINSPSAQVCIYPQSEQKTHS